MKRTAILTLIFAGALAQAAPRTWHFTCDYYNLDLKGHLINRQRFVGDYTRGLPNDMVRWNGVAIQNGNSFEDKFAPPQKQEFMEGLTYAHSAAAGGMLKPEFFKAFPPTAIQQRNLIWDTHMFEDFAGNFDKLKPNEVFHLHSGDADLAGMGTFRDHDVQLILSGTTTRNGKKCAVIDYRALFNTLDTKMPGVDMVGRSDYWGQIWLALDTREIEYATLFEEVTGQVTLSGQEKPLNIAVVRVGTFE